MLKCIIVSYANTLFVLSLIRYTLYAVHWQFMLALMLHVVKSNFRAALLSVPLVLLYGALLCLTGMVMYAYFANEGCDPLAAGMITNGNQVSLL